MRIWTIMWCWLIVALTVFGARGVAGAARRTATSLSFKDSAPGGLRTGISPSLSDW